MLQKISAEMEINMKVRVPHYYEQFHCIASKCKDNCCVGGWEIDIDDDTYEYYQQIPGEFGDKLRASIMKTDAYCFKLVDGHCPFLDDHKLCGLYKEVGEEHLGVVCAEFPRFTEYYGNVKEKGIGLACEEAERIIFSDRDVFSMVEMEDSEGCEEDSEYDSELGRQLFAARDAAFLLLEDQSLSIHEKLIVLLSMGADIQELINHNQVNDIKNLITRYTSDHGDRCLQELHDAYEEDSYPNISVKDGIRSILYAYEELETLNPEWTNALNHIIEIFHNDQMDDNAYSILASEFYNQLGERSYEYKNLLEYFVFRYFMKAAYDHDVFGKIQLMVTNFLVIKEMDIDAWLTHNKTFSFENRIDTVHIFSREVEYSEDNLEILAEEFIFDDIFKKDQLIALLWIDSASE